MSRPWLTWSLLASLAIAFLLQPVGAVSGLALQPDAFAPWQLASYALVHAGWAHLVANAALLAWLGPPAEAALGRWRFGAVLAGAAVAGGATQLGASWLLGPPGAAPAIVGASGALYGLLAARWRLQPAEPVLRASVAVFGGLALVGAISGLGAGVAAYAHLGGLFAGWGLMAAWGRRRARPQYAKRPEPVDVHLG